MFRYPGGECQVRLTPEQVKVIRGLHTGDSIHIVARITDGDIMPIAQLVDAIRLICSLDIKLILPYLPYGRADRRFVEGDCGGLWVFGQLLNTFTFVEVITLDVHSKEAARCIRNFTDVSPKPIIDSVIDSIEQDSRAVGVLLPDAGAARYGINTKLVCEKQRNVATGKLGGFIVPPRSAFRGLDAVLIVDDICDGGGTFNGIAQAMFDYGLDMYLYVTHGIFSKGHTDLLKRFKKIYTTDSFGTKVHADPIEADRVVTIPCMGTILSAVVVRSELYADRDVKETNRIRCEAGGMLNDT